MSRGRYILPYPGFFRGLYELLEADFDLWLSCHTQEEIAEAVGCIRETVRDLVSNFGDFGKLAEFPKDVQAVASHLADFDPPIYNIWRQQVVRLLLLRGIGITPQEPAP